MTPFKCRGCEKDSADTDAACLSFRLCAACLLRDLSASHARYGPRCYQCHWLIPTSPGGGVVHCAKKRGAATALSATCGRWELRRVMNPPAPEPEILKAADAYRRGVRGRGR